MELWRLFLERKFERYLIFVKSLVQDTSLFTGIVARLQGMIIHMYVFQE